jgi:glycoprotein endo-alpha-1,2-mannosidase
MNQSSSRLIIPKPPVLPGFFHTISVDLPVHLFRPSDTFILVRIKLGMSHLYTDQRGRTDLSKAGLRVAYSCDDSGDESEENGTKPLGVEQSADPRMVGFEETKEQYYPSNGTPSTCDDEIPSTPFPRREQRRGIFCCALSYLQKRRIASFCSYFIVFAFGIFVGSVILQGMAQPKGDDSEDFFSSPWLRPEGNITVGVYYYPWYSDDFHRGSGYLRDQLATSQQPVLGEYDDSDPKVINQHLKWSAQANVRLWVTSWWGPGAREDTTTKDVILQHSALGDHKIALFYETTGRIKESEGYSTHRVVPDIEYICRNYFSHPNYYRIDGKPVLFLYLSRKLEGLGILDHVVGQMRLVAGDLGYKIFVVGDHVFHQAPDDDEMQPPFTILDAVTNYDVYGSMFRPSPYATEAGVRQHFQRTREWQVLAAEQKCAFIPSVAPGYNDLGVRPDKRNGPLSRKLTANDPPGSLFKTSLQYARKLVDPSIGNLIMVNSFNEWHEDTQIEPAQGETTNLPEILTQGIEYQGYGEHYLNILREETT